MRSLSRRLYCVPIQRGAQYFLRSSIAFRRYIPHRGLSWWDGQFRTLGRVRSSPVWGGLLRYPRVSLALSAGRFDFLTRECCLGNHPISTAGQSGWFRSKSSAHSGIRASGVDMRLFLPLVTQLGKVSKGYWPCDVGVFFAVSGG